MEYILKFISPCGKIEMGGGKHDFFRLISVHGLGFPELERQTVVYSGSHGEKTVATRFLPRVITVSGDLMDKKNVSHLVRVIGEEGTLYIKSLNGERVINVRATTMEEPVQIGSVTRIVLQFVADDPRFSDAVSFKQGIYSRKNLIIGSFTLPCVFTERITGGCIINSGETEVLPKIIIHCESAAEKETELFLLNENTGAKIAIKRKFTAGDEITVDTKNAEITDKVGNSLLYQMTDDTYLSEFVLKKGENNISVHTGESSFGTKVYCVYQNKYLEAIL